MVTRGMMCLVITAITTLVLKVLGIPTSLIIMFYEPQLADSAPMKTFNYINFELYIKWFNEHELRASFVRYFLRVTFFPYVIFSR